MSVELACRVEGPKDAPVVVLAPSLGTTWEMWDGLSATLSPYRVVRVDTRGHGRSPVPPGPYAVAELAGDVLALADRIGVERFGFVGLSLGGAIGQQLLVTAPERVVAAVLCCTLPRFGEPAPWHERAATVREHGMAAMAGPTPARWFTDAFRVGSPDEVARHLAMIAGVDPEGYASCCEALAGHDLWDGLGGVRTPVRVVAGALDPVCPPGDCEAMAAAIPGADLVVVPDTSHIATVAGAPFERAVTEFLEGQL